jgi:peptidoglycan/xylan/chitin deacetylase (PgdA/CDA1 family)
VRDVALRSAVVRAFRGPPARAAAAALERLLAAPAGSFAVLTYHRVDAPSAKPWLYPPLLSATPDAFAAQMQAIARGSSPIGLPDLIAAVHGGPRLPRRAVLVTFDDAYADFRDVAWPILRRFGIAPTLFVPTAYPDAPAERFWWDRLWNAVRTTSSTTLEAAGARFELDGHAQRLRAARAVADRLKSLDHERAVEMVEELVDRLGEGKAPTGREAATGRTAPKGRENAAAAAADVIGWADLRSLAAEGVHVAAHSRTHPVLPRVAPERLEEELVGSRRDLEHELGGAAFPTVFAYPAGRHDDGTRAALARLGFELAFTTERGANRVGVTDPLRIRRINVAVRSGTELIRAQLSVFAFDTSRYRAGTA